MQRTSIFRRDSVRVALAACAVAVWVSTVGGEAIAQPQQQRSGEFFDKNFAETPLKPREEQRGTARQKSSERQNQRDPRLPDRKSLEAMTKDAVDKMFKDGALPQDLDASGAEQSSISEDENQRDLTGLVRAVPVQAVGAILNSIDSAHYLKSLEQLTELAISRDLNIGTVYALGDLKVASENPYVGKIIARGGIVHIVSNVPKGYPVSLSPTWIVKTAEGEVLLEAVGTLDKYFNKRGEFLDREKRSPLPAGT
jgi:hypothetical protein